MAMKQPNELTATQRRHGMIVMIVNSFMMWGGFFMVVPLISIHYVEALGWTTASIGIVLRVRQLCRQCLTVVGGRPLWCAALDPLWVNCPLCGVFGDGLG